jgi:hypothetical protein
MLSNQKESIVRNKNALFWLLAYSPKSRGAQLLFSRPISRGMRTALPGDIVFEMPTPLKHWSTKILKSRISRGPSRWLAHEKYISREAALWYKLVHSKSGVG